MILINNNEVRVRVRVQRTTAATYDSIAPAASSSVGKSTVSSDVVHPQLHASSCAVHSKAVQEY